MNTLVEVNESIYYQFSKVRHLINDFDSLVKYNFNNIIVDYLMNDTDWLDRNFVDFDKTADQMIDLARQIEQNTKILQQKINEQKGISNEKSD
jgi:flagellar basal body rod protein FlgB